MCRTRHIKSFEDDKKLKHKKIYITAIITYNRQMIDVCKNILLGVKLWNLAEITLGYILTILVHKSQNR